MGTSKLRIGKNRVKIIAARTISITQSTNFTCPSFEMKEVKEKWRLFDSVGMCLEVVIIFQDKYIMAT